LIKFWKLLVGLQYEKVEEVATVPLKFKVYEMAFPLLEKGLGNLFTSREMVREKEEVFFNKFCYDIVSLLGMNLKLFSIEDLLHIFRLLYKAITHRFNN